MKLSTVSVIITTKNEGDNIEYCLKSIQNQTYKKIEIIVVDNDSKDQTIAIAKRYTTKIISGGPERSAQRNIGLDASKGRFLLFLDADMELEKSVIQDCIEHVGSTISGAIIPEYSEGVGFWGKCKVLERRFYIHIDWIEAARFFPKRVLDIVGAYDEDLTGPEDFDLSQRVRNYYGDGSIVRISSRIIHHEGNPQFFQLMKKKFYYGKSMHLYLKHRYNHDYLPKQANIFFRYILFFRMPKLLFKNPLLSIGMFMLKTSELVALGLGAAYGAIQK